MNTLSRKELAENSVNRRFDQIVAAVGDLEKVQGKISSIYGLQHWTKGNIYGCPSRSTWMKDIELVLIQPGEEPSIWREFADKYGQGICCVSENLPADRWQAEIDRYSAMGIPVFTMPEDETGKTVVLDTLDRIGGLIALHLDSDTRKPQPDRERNNRTLSQINITTTNVEDTCDQLIELLQIGPFSVGTLNNQSVKNASLLVNGMQSTPEFSFQLAIMKAGNLEFEVIQPVKGPTVYQSFINRRGTGYHHIKEVVPPEELESTLRGYVEKGMPICIRGTVDITSFAYIDSERDFTFYVEFGDGLVPEKFPEGYNEYIYPAE